MAADISEPKELAVSKKPSKLKITKDDLMFHQELGSGAFSKVSLASHSGTGMKYAVKIISKQQILNDGKEECVMNERNILKNLHHPAIVKLVSTFQTSDDLYFVLEFCENGELLDCIQKHGSLDYDITRTFAAELVSALEFMHSKSVIHRDIKPENILLDKHYHVRLADFGTAIISNEEPQLLRQSFDEDVDILNSEDNDIHDKCRNRGLSKSFCGTAQYASPELLTSCITTYSSDLWALGCVIFQMATGYRPFQDPSDYLTFKRILDRDIHFPESIHPQIRDICDHLLVLDPCARLGVGDKGYCKLMAHPLFNGLVFETLFDHPNDFTFVCKRPLWVPDSDVTKCHDCGICFTLFLRKHHCRSCGNIFCSKCSNKQTTGNALNLANQKVRVCNSCGDRFSEKQEISSCW